MYRYFAITYVWPHLRTTFRDLNQQKYVQSENLKYLKKIEDNTKSRISAFYRKNVIFNLKYFFLTFFLDLMELTLSIIYIRSSKANKDL